jgi:hypothetical protein
MVSEPQFYRALGYAESAACFRKVVDSEPTE